MRDNTIEILGLSFDALSLNSTVERVLDHPTWLVTANLDHMRRYHTSLSVRELLKTADVIVADGMPLVWASRILGQALPERVTGTDLLPEIARIAEKKGSSLFFLGGAPGIAERLANLMKKRFPQLIVAGHYCPPYGYEKNPSELKAIHDLIRDSNPDVVLVALGFPKQDNLIRELITTHPRASYLGVGMAFGFIVGEPKRAPVWMRTVGLEWLHRLVQEPRRLFRRYLLDGIPFALELLAWSLLSRYRKKA